DRYGYLQATTVHALESLLDVHGITRRTPRLIEPDLFISHYSDGVDDERRIVHPFADRIAVIARLRNFFGEITRINPDVAPSLFEFIQNHHAPLVLHDLCVPHLVEIGAWE